MLKTGGADALFDPLKRGFISSYAGITLIRLTGIISVSC
jgi:hypothetical protein